MDYTQVFDSNLDKRHTAFKEELRKDVEFVVSNVPTLYKYIDYDGGLNLLSNSNLLIRNPSKFNDPYDCYSGLINFDNMPDDYIKNLINKYYPDASRQERRNKIRKILGESKKGLISLFKSDFIESERQGRGIVCFSADYDNILMWSQYADSHKGMCIGFNLGKLYWSLKESLYNEIALLKVVYTNRLNPNDYFKDEYKAVIDWLRIKSDVWAYENEIRISLGPIVFDDRDCKLVKFDNSVVQEIYFGSQMGEQEQSIIADLINPYHQNVTSFKMNLSKINFNLITNEI